jgi:hypothetical protein
MDERDVIDFGDFVDQICTLQHAEKKIVFLPVAVRIFLGGLQLLSLLTYSYGITRVGENGRLQLNLAGVVSRVDQFLVKPIGPFFQSFIDQCGFLNHHLAVSQIYYYLH